MCKKSKRKKWSSGSEDNSRQRKKKIVQSRGPSEGEFLFSDVLSQANTVLYRGEQQELLEGSNLNLNLDTSIFSPGPQFAFDRMESMSQSEAASTSVQSQAMSQSVSGAQPTNQDIMLCLRNIETRLNHMDKRFDTFEEVKTKIGNVEIEIRKLWTTLEDRTKKVEDRIILVEEKVESSDFSLGLVNDKVLALRKERDRLSDEVVYLQSQSMRNNLLFSNIPEARGEFNEDAEVKVRKFIVEKMKLTQDIVDKIVLERVHRIGPKQDGRCRRIVAKFLDYKDKEIVRKQWKHLKGTPYYVNEQFPKEVADKRKRLFPKMKAARQEGKTAWMSHDTLNIDGKAVRD